MAYKNFRKTEIIDELGAELRKVRNQKELTLAQVAAGLGELGTQISSIMLGRIETGQRRIDDDLFLAAGLTLLRSRNRTPCQMAPMMMLFGL